MVTLPIGVTDSGEKYAKFPDGTLIQWGNLSLTLPTASSEGKVTVNYPINFSNAIVFVVITNRYTNSNTTIWSNAGVEKNKFDAHFWRTAQLPAGRSADATWLAIGRWK